MTSEELVRDIAALEANASATRIRLDELVVASRPEIASAAVKWIDAEVSRRVAERPDAFLALSDEQIKDMKLKVAAARDAAVAVVTAQLADQANWPHRAKPKPKEQDSTNREPFFQAVFRNAICTLGPVLDEFGLTSVPIGHMATWKRVSPSTVLYVIDPGFDSRQTRSLSDFHAIYAKLGDLENKLAATRTALEKARALERWTSA